MEWYKDIFSIKHSVYGRRFDKSEGGYGPPYLERFHSWFRNDGAKANGDNGKGAVAKSMCVVYNLC